MMINVYAIQTYHSNRLRYWNAGAWSDREDDALLFVREADALRVQSDMLDGAGKVFAIRFHATPQAEVGEPKPKGSWSRDGTL
jgi:hypothetical protein